jgi:hypothetical protein
MAKKRSHPVDAPKAVPLLTGASAHERALKDANAVWTKAIEEASRNYDQAMHGAWSRYIGAMKIHQDANGKKAKTGGTDFDKKFDQDRENALRTWHAASATADKKLERVVNSVGGDLPTDETE